MRLALNLCFDGWIPSAEETVATSNSQKWVTSQTTLNTEHCKELVESFWVTVAFTALTNCKVVGIHSSIPPIFIYFPGGIPDRTTFIPELPGVVYLDAGLWRDAWEVALVVEIWDTGRSSVPLKTNKCLLKINGLEVGRWYFFLLWSYENPYPKSTGVTLGGPPCSSLEGSPVSRPSWALVPNRAWRLAGEKLLSAPWRTRRSAEPMRQMCGNRRWVFGVFLRICNL